MTSIQQSLPAFFVWWGSELRACIPSGLVGLVRPTRRLSLLWQDKDVQLRWTAGRGTRDLGRLATDLTGAEASAAFARITATVPWKHAEIVLELPPERVLRREVELPIAAAENLREVLGFELDRLTPFKADDAVFDYRVARVDRANKRMTVSLAVAPRDLIQRLQAFCADLGVVADRITTSTERADTRRPFDLNPAEGTAPQQSRWRAVTVALAAIAAILVILALWLPLQRKQEILAAYEEQLAEFRLQATEAAALREEFKAKAEQGSFIMRHRAETTLAVTVLKDITERLEDDAWLVQFRLSGRELTIGGYAQTATSLVPALEDSPLLTAVKFSAPVTPDASINRDRFGIVAEVAGQ